MENSEREDSYYHPGGVPITPQAREFGYEFPVYVSQNVWSTCCTATGIPSKRGTNLELRIRELLQHLYEGMAKKLAVSDDFLYYSFKVWFWSRNRPNSNKKQRMRLGARLFLDPSTDAPWLYIFAPNVDSIDALTKGESDGKPSGETMQVLAEGEVAFDEAEPFSSGPEEAPAIQQDGDGSESPGGGSEA